MSDKKGYRSDNKAISNWRTYNKKKQENRTGRGILNMVKFYNNMNYGKKVMGQASQGADIAKFYSQSPEVYKTMDPTLQAIYSPERLKLMSETPLNTAGGNSFNSFLDMAKQSYFPNQDVTALSELGNYGKTLGVNPPIGSSAINHGVSGGVTANAPATTGGLTTGTTANSVSTSMANSSTAIAGQTGSANAIAGGGAGAGAGAGTSASGGLASSALANPYTAIAMALLGIGIGAGKKGSTLQRWFNPNGGVK